MNRRDTEAQRVNQNTEEIIGAAIEVHHILGPGLLESVLMRNVSAGNDPCEK